MKDMKQELLSRIVDKNTRTMHIERHLAECDTIIDEGFYLEVRTNIGFENEGAHFIYVNNDIVSEDFLKLDIFDGLSVKNGNAEINVLPSDDEMYATARGCCKDLFNKR